LSDGVVFFTNIVLGGELVLGWSKVTPGTKARGNTSDLLFIMERKVVSRKTLKMLLVANVTNVMIKTLTLKGRGCLDTSFIKYDLGDVLGGLIIKFSWVVREDVG